MHPRSTRALAALLALVLLPCAAPLAAQAAAPRAAPMAADSVTRAVFALDSALFDAYNRCDLARLGALVSDDLEFYHDRTGREVGRAPFLASIRRYVCGHTRRELVASTFQAHALGGDGYFEMGEHLFCDPARFRRCPDAESGIAKFFMIWRREGDAWRLARVVSYDHLNSNERPARRD